MHLDTRASRENRDHHGQVRPEVTLVAQLASALVV